MPLIQGKSKKSFSKNVEKEMNAGKPQNQALAIAYSVKRKNQRKKMASGGSVELSAKDERRPMPDQEFADLNMDARQHEKALEKSKWDDNTWSSQASESFSKSSGEADEDFVSEREANADNQRRPESQRMRKMANGGAVESTPSTGISEHEDEYENARARRQLEQEHDMEWLARGGEVSPQDEINEDHDASVVAAIMAKRRKMADGGMVDLEENSKEQPNNEDDMSYDAVLKEQYDDSQISPQPEDSNEHGDDIASDEHDMVESIRRQMKSKRQR